MGYKYQAICDVCGWKMDADKLRKRWDGFMVCQEDWETRNILDFYRTRNDAHLLPFTRPDNDGVDVSPPINPATHTNPGFCTPNGKLAIPDSSTSLTAIAGCMIAGNIGAIY